MVYTTQKSWIANNYIYIIDASFSCVCPAIDHEFHHNIVKVAMDPRGDIRRLL